MNFWGMFPQVAKHTFTPRCKVEWLQLDALLHFYTKLTPGRPVGAAWALVKVMVHIHSNRETNWTVPRVCGTASATAHHHFFGHTF